MIGCTDCGFGDAGLTVMLGATSSAAIQHGAFKEPKYLIDFFYFFSSCVNTSLSLIPTTESNPARLSDPKSPAPPGCVETRGAPV